MTTDTAEATTAHEVVDDSHHVHITSTPLLAGIFFAPMFVSLQRLTRIWKSRYVKAVSVKIFITA